MLTFNLAGKAEAGKADMGKPDMDAWVLAKRGARMPVDSAQPYGYFVEDECSASGEIVPVATILLTNRECPWRCVMCDLWKNTLTSSVDRGTIPLQIEYALSCLPPARHIKLYNSGSFFDNAAIPIEDLPAIAERLRLFERVIVESHPALIGKSTLLFRDLLDGRLEVAMGLETAHPDVLRKLNKGMTLRQFSEAAEMLRRNDIDLRTFILLQPPFMNAVDALFWAERSLDFAFGNGTAVATLIPTRGGNGAMETLASEGLFTAPRLRTLESALDYGLELKKGRVFADLWDLQASPDSCSMCFELRRSRLKKINMTQGFIPRVSCIACKDVD